MQHWICAIDVGIFLYPFPAFPGIGNASWHWLVDLGLCWLGRISDDTQLLFCAFVCFESLEVFGGQK